MAKRKARSERVQEARQSLEIQEAALSISDDEVKLSPRELQQIQDVAESTQEVDKMIEAALMAKKNKEALRRAKEAVNKSVPSNVLVQRPSYGPISGTASYHTVDAYRFLLGRNSRTVELEGERVRQQRIVGLFEAADNIKKIEAGYISGCPYAAWTLIQIEKKLKEIRSSFAKSKTEADNLIAISTQIELRPFSSKNPTHVVLNFKSNYAFHFADLLSQYDLLLRSVLNYRLNNFISNDEYRNIERQIGTPLRALFRLTESWEFVGIDAVRQKTAKLLEAEHMMGILPDEILNDKVKPQFVRGPSFVEINASEDNSVEITEKNTSTDDGKQQSDDEKTQGDSNDGL